MASAIKRHKLASEEALARELAGRWRYRVQNYRLLCHIEDQTLTVLVLRVGHRKDVYED